MNSKEFDQHIIWMTEALSDEAAGNRNTGLKFIYEICREYLTECKAYTNQLEQEIAAMRQQLSLHTELDCK